LLKLVRVDLEFVPRKIRSSPDANWGDIHESHTSRQNRRGNRNPDYNNASLVNAIRALRNLKFSVVFMNCRICGTVNASWVEQVNF
jgi:hypothetical protein